MLDTKTILSQEEQIYRQAFDLVNDNLPNGTTIAANYFGGTFRLPNGSRIEFIPHYEKDKQDALVKSNTAYHIKKFLENVNLNQSLEELNTLVGEYMNTKF